MKKTLVLLLLLISNSFSRAQVTFQERIGISGGQRGYSIEQATDGGYIISGLTFNAASYLDIYLVKTDSAGHVQWSKDFAAAGEEEGFAVRQTSDGGYIVTGRTASFNGVDYDIFLIKTDANGDSLWTKRYSTTEDDYGTDVQQTSDGGYIIAGYTTGTINIYGDMMLIKTDAYGDTLWTRVYGTLANERCHSVRQTADGGYIMSGYTFFSGTQHADDFYIIRTDASGDTLWTRSYGPTTGDDWAFYAQQTADGGFIIAGYTEDFGSGSHDILLIKTDANGDTLWSKVYGGTNSDYPNFVQQTADGGYIVGGVTFSFGAGNMDMYLVKTDANGDTLWTRAFGGTNLDDLTSLKQAADGGYIVTGSTLNFGSQGYDLYLIKTDANGNSGCNETGTATIVTPVAPVRHYPATLVDHPAIVLNAAPFSINTAFAFTPICPVVGIHPADDTDMQTEVNIAPNPAGEFAVINMLFAEGDKIHLSDVTGKILMTEKITSAARDFKLHTSAFADGIYFLSISNKQKNYCDKLIIQK